MAQHGCNYRTRSALIAVGIAYVAGHSATAGTNVSPLTASAWGVALIAGLVMLVAWIERCCASPSYTVGAGSQAC
jgi:hypothetical protein